jgi:hypothetical protein
MVWSHSFCWLAPQVLIPGSATDEITLQQAELALPKEISKGTPMLITSRNLQCRDVKDPLAKINEMKTTSKHMV